MISSRLEVPEVLLLLSPRAWDTGLLSRWIIIPQAWPPLDHCLWVLEPCCVFWGIGKQGMGGHQAVHGSNPHFSWNPQISVSSLLSKALFFSQRPPKTPSIIHSTSFQSVLWATERTNDFWWLPFSAPQKYPRQEISQLTYLLDMKEKNCVNKLHWIFLK